MATTDTSSAQKLTFLTMTAMVVGSMVGAGVFSLPRRFAQETGIFGALIAWGSFTHRPRSCSSWPAASRAGSIFSPGELVILAGSIMGAVLGVAALSAGWITI